MRNTINHKQSCIILFILLVTIKCNAQTDSNWVLKFTKKGKVFLPRLTDYQPSKKGFYLYENGIYSLKLKDGSAHEALIKKIIKDSIIFTEKNNYKLIGADCEEKILTVSPSQIKLIRINDNPMIDFFTSKKLKKYDFDFSNSSQSKKFFIDTIINHGVKSEVIKKVTAFGAIDTYVQFMYPQKHEPYVAPKIDSSKFKTRNFIWLSPLHAKEINGIAIGVATGNSMFSEMPITINGINLNVDLVTGLTGMMFMPYTFSEINTDKYDDSLQIEGKIIANGISISAGGVVEGRQFNGIFINGGLCESYKANGIFISGVRNIFQDIRGVSISGLRNDAYSCTGVQIALINNCKNLKGIQIGLWNVNSKRKLPFINWGT
jgi:hypothetical protein